MRDSMPFGFIDVNRQKFKKCVYVQLKQSYCTTKGKIFTTDILELLLYDYIVSKWLFLLFIYLFVYLLQCYL